MNTITSRTKTVFAIASIPIAAICASAVAPSTEEPLSAVIVLEHGDSVKTIMDISRLTVQGTTDEIDEISADEDAEMSISAQEVEVIPDPVPEPLYRSAAPASNNSSSSSSNSSSASSSSSSTVPPDTTVKDSPSTASGNEIVAYAKTLIGIPYVYGGTTTAGFDCSGFTQYVYAHFGYNIPRTSGSQYGAGEIVSNPKPGDLVWAPGHVGIYVGNGQMIHSPQPGKSVQIRGLLSNEHTFIRIVG